uniref:Phosphopyruvate hydratase n=1 Tax=Panagrellus redivivus TaxID=6233 RepID=A0A7E4V9L8_PANRE
MACHACARMTSSRRRYDVDHSVVGGMETAFSFGAIKDMIQAALTFDHILEMLRDSTFNKQQRDYEVAKAAESA